MCNLYKLLHKLVCNLYKLLHKLVCNLYKLLHKLVCNLYKLLHKLVCNLQLAGMKLASCICSKNHVMSCDIKALHCLPHNLLL